MKDNLIFLRPMVNNQIKTFCIDLNAQHKSGMTHLELAAQIQLLGAIEY